MYKRQHKEAKPKKVLSEEIAFLISHILSDNNARADAFGTNSFLRVPGKTVAVKTGTTNDKKDNWTVGYTNNVTVGVWVGNNDNTPMNPKIASGLTGASSIWNAVMKELFAQGYKDGIMKVPENVEAIEIDALLGGLPKDGSPSRSEYFVKGTQPTDISPFYKKVKSEYLWFRPFSGLSCSPYSSFPPGRGIYDNRLLLPPAVSPGQQSILSLLRVLSHMQVLLHGLLVQSVRFDHQSVGILLL